MKKSEMIELIYDKLDEYQDSELTRKLAKEILEIVIDYGMLPPHICYNSIDEYGVLMDTELLTDNDISLCWEPEDERNNS